MIKRSHLINKLKGLGYRFSDQSQRVEIFRKRGSTHRIILHKTDWVSEEFARSILRQADCDRAEIDKFIREARA